MLDAFRYQLPESLDGFRYLIAYRSHFENSASKLQSDWTFLQLVEHFCKFVWFLEKTSRLVFPWFGPFF